MDQTEKTVYNEAELARFEEIKAIHRQTLGNLYPNTPIQEHVIEYIAGIDLKGELRAAALSEMVDHDEYNPDILSQNGFYRATNPLLEESAREMHNLGEMPARAPGVIGYLDLDGFKNVNDQYGHIMGDAYLNLVGQIIAATLRPGDLVARLHGDEFAFFLKGVVDLDVGVIIAERIRNAITDSIPLFNQNPNDPEDKPLDINLSASIGLATFAKGNISSQLATDESRQQLVTNADANADLALYEAKAAGRNCIGVFSDEGPVRIANTKPDPDHPDQTIVEYH
ncbi:GGDEF domain-containing protein [Candidatus Daviesbacteria bacterium]|nr:GGDEF domain-containing protein [Candidatus Daviesbacteria bacterium]